MNRAASISLGLAWHSFATCQIICDADRTIEAWQRSLALPNNRGKWNRGLLWDSFGLPVYREKQLVGDVVLRKLSFFRKSGNEEAERTSYSTVVDHKLLFGVGQAHIFVIVEFIIRFIPSNESSEARSSLIRLTAFDSLAEISSAFLSIHSNVRFCRCLLSTPPQCMIARKMAQTSLLDARRIAD